jgi:hypothetical protein
MKRKLDLIDALTDAETLPDEVIDYLIDNHSNAMKVEFSIFFDKDYECDTPPEEIGAIYMLQVVNCIKNEEWFRYWMNDAICKAITEHEQFWRDEHLPGLIKLWRMDDDEDAHDE